jgi:hypothetical protein
MRVYPLILVAFVLLAASPGFAQTTQTAAQTDETGSIKGNLTGNVLDNHGAALAGVSVTLSGAGSPIEQATDARGQYRFPGLAPGRYQLGAHLDGYRDIEPTGTITVRPGQNAINLHMTRPGY